MSASALLKSRVRKPSYLKKLAKAEDLIDLFPNGTYGQYILHCGLSERV